MPRLLDPNNTEWNGLLELLKEEGNTGTFSLKEPVPYIPPEVLNEIKRGDFTVNDMNRFETLMTRVDYDEVEQKLKRAAKDTAKEIVKGFNWFGDKAEEQLMPGLRSSIYATLALLWNIFAGGTGWAMLSLINEEHDELDPLLRPPVTANVTTNGFCGFTTRGSVTRTDFDVISGLDEMSITIAPFECIADSFHVLNTSQMVVNWIE